MLAKLARTTPYYKRNLPHICSFFVKGTCNRGAECPYRHEMPPEESDLSKQNIKDRYYGVNDPVAKRILARATERRLTAPEDPTITTLYIGGINPFITEADLRCRNSLAVLVQQQHSPPHDRGVFYAYGELQSINVISASKCAFVEYTTRAAAEAAVEGVGASFEIKGHRLRVAWGKSSAQSTLRDVLGTSCNHYLLFLVPGQQQPRIGTAPFAHAFAPPAGFFNVPSAPPPPSMMMGGQQMYPSMNPAAMGSRPEGAPSTSGGDGK